MTSNLIKLSCAFDGKMPAQPRISVLPYLDAVAQSDAGLDAVNFIEHAARRFAFARPQFLDL